MLPLVVQIERVEEHAADTRAFVSSPVRIGRNPLNDLVLNASYISQWHAVVRFDGNKTYYVDLGATNPTLVNGQPVPRHVEVPVDETVDVRVGNTRLHFLRAAAPQDLISSSRRSSAFSLSSAADMSQQMDATICLQDEPADGPRSGQGLPTVSGSAHLGGPQAQAAPSPQARATPSSPAPRPNVALETAVQAQSMPAPPTGPEAQPEPFPAPPRPGDPDPVLSAQVASIVEQLGPYNKAYRYAWSNFVDQISGHMENKTPQQRTALAAALHQAYPEAASERGFGGLLRNLGVAAPAMGGVPELEDWLKRLTNGLFPPPGFSVDIAVAMEHVGAVLEVFSQAFVELRETQRQFSEEMGLMRIEEDSPLQKSSDPRAVLAFLLNPTPDEGSRIEQLSRVFAELALHHLALLKATVEGGRSLMRMMAPESIGEDGSLKPEQDDQDEEGLLSRMFPYEARRMWRLYVALHQKLSEEDRFTRELFGRAFARAYYTFTGGCIEKPPTF